MNYRERLAEGRAIGSGQVERACKSMIGARLKQGEPELVKVYDFIDKKLGKATP